LLHQQNRYREGVIRTQRNSDPPAASPISQIWIPPIVTEPSPPETEASKIYRAIPEAYARLSNRKLAAVGRQAIASGVY